MSPMSIQEYANRFVCDLVAYEPGKPIEETARELGLKPEEIVKLASNENPLGPSPLAKAAMREAIEAAHIYPDGGGYCGMRLRTASVSGWRMWFWQTGRMRSSSCCAIVFCVRARP